MRTRKLDKTKVRILMEIYEGTKQVAEADITNDSVEEIERIMLYQARLGRTWDIKPKEEL